MHSLSKAQHLQQLSRLTLPGIRERKESLRSQILLCMDEPENYEDSGWELRFMHEDFLCHLVLPWDDKVVSFCVD